MPVDYINEHSKDANGGTEMMGRKLEAILPTEVLDKYQIILSRVREIDETKLRVFYAHDLPQDGESSHLADKGHERFHRLVFVSHWQQQAYINHFKLPWHKCIVLQNAIEPILLGDKPEKPKDKIHLIYHTTPHRGLRILVPVFEKLAEEYGDKIHLDVFSSFGIYGWAERDKEFESDFERIRNHKNMTYHGTKPNEVVREYLRSAHIFAYPSIWPETSCISLMEAMSAGCICVHPNFAALPETAANFTWMYNWHEEANAHAGVFYHMLKEAIEGLLPGMEADSLKTAAQVGYTNLFYSWDLRKNQWLNFLKSFEDEPVAPPKGPMFVYSTTQ